MNTLRVHIYTSERHLPVGLSRENFFHSPHFFALCAQTPRYKPYMLTVEQPDGTVCAQLLAVLRYRSTWLPPFIYRHCRILGEGCYADESQKGELLGMMLRQLTERLGPWTLYFEVSNLSAKMTGYRQFRENDFFPVRWMSIHNSLHSRTPEERITPRLQRQIDAAYERGVVTDEVATDDDFRSFMRLLRQHHWLKPKRYIPAAEFFQGLRQCQDGRLYLTRYREHIIGCSAVAYSQGQAYLWYAAYRRKTYAWLHPAVLTVWHAIKDSHRRRMEHIFFMDVGLPFRKNAYREFILRFGGKPTSTYRWFRCSIGWVNSVLSWFYRD